MVAIVHGSEMLWFEEGLKRRERDAEDYRISNGYMYVKQKKVSQSKTQDKVRGRMSSRKSHDWRSRERLFAPHPISTRKRNEGHSPTLIRRRDARKSNDQSIKVFPHPPMDVSLMSF